MPLFLPNVAADAEISPAGFPVEKADVHNKHAGQKNKVPLNPREEFYTKKEFTEWV